MNVLKVAIVTSGYFPVPATKGGAVEALVDNIIKENEDQDKIHLYIFSSYDEKAEIIAKSFKRTSVIFVKTPWIIRCADKIIFHIAKDVLKKEKSLSYRYICQRLWFIHKTAQNLHKEEYDRVVLENHSSLFMIMKEYKNYIKYNNKYYYHLHNVVTNDYGCIDIIKKTKRVLGVSNYINETLKNFIGNCNVEYRVLRNRIDSTKFRVHLSATKKIEVRQKYGIKDDDIVILFVGRFSPEKGIKELLAAFKGIENPNAVLLVVGGYYFGSGMSSHFEEEMKSLVKSLEDRVKFTGFIDYNLISQIYAIADIVVIPSVWDDPAPLTVIESLSAGKALITTYSGGISEYANDEVAIVLERTELEEHLKTAIESLLEDEQKRDYLAQKALEYTKEWNISSYYRDFVLSIE